MRISKVLFTAMLAYSYCGIAQEFTPNKELDSIQTSEKISGLNEKTIDSLFLSKIELYYEKRNKRSKKRENKRKVSSLQVKNQSEKVERTYFSCPSCGRG